MLGDETARRCAPGAEDSEGGAADNQQLTATSEERHSVSDLVSKYGEPLGESQKRGRSESGDLAPAGKRGARGEPSGGPGRSPSATGNKNLREHLDAAIDGLENRIMASLSRDLHEFRETLSAEIARLNDRVRDLERHVEERDGVISDLTDELHQSRTEVAALQTRVEDAEMNSRLPCLVLSGSAMAPRHAPRLAPPLRGQPAPAAIDQSQPSATAAPAGAGQGQTEPAAPADHRDREEREDVTALVVNTLNKNMPGLNLAESDIDRAHRLPGPNNRVIVRFVRSGEGSVRDRVMSRRLELRGKELFVSESLTKLRSLIFRSLLAAKRDKKIYTVYSRGGHVYYKDKQYGVGKRVNSVSGLRELGVAVLER
ncbi:hypothetical protein FJT64_005301 [Amphibalanus amphitrite]|uniref:Uncharacterized protein n=1 Tax=Amphibalanus amphitrite TaxID=1232801 RepID=A0A6A4VLK8_AMPAM|nr:hypothetical protein FJT64_005301 [Amphibalanus amphitrite]